MCSKERAPGCKSFTHSPLAVQVPEHLIIHEHGGLDKFKYTVIEATLETTFNEVGSSLILFLSAGLYPCPEC